ncbi:MAG: ABC-F family ATP-binding cassette domain-containing protein [Lachnospiraceae bacterium]|nr:ABC-F family ATP-binding cassette domain-containing protein [Lachnospiraceae bacterium]
MILSCQNIKVEFVTGVVLSNVSFHIERGEKAAIVGINGAGKSTLLRSIVGEINPDEGICVFEKDATYGYLSQDANVNTENTIFDELLSVKSDIINMEKRLREFEEKMSELSGDELDTLLNKYESLSHNFRLMGGETYMSEVYGVLNGLGFFESDYQKLISTLSGGQKTRVALGKMLLQSPDLIILDEPTNHLDLASISWLENYLKNYKGAVLIVSHDRYFLDKIVTKIIELENGKSYVYTGNYSDYSVKKEQRRITELKAYLNQQADIKHQEAVIEKLKSFNREKSIKRAESREKMLDKIERIEKPATINADMKLVLTPHMQSGEDVLKVEDMSKSYGTLRLFDNVNFEIKRGEHVAIIGNNGTGKTTLLKILNELEKADKGSFTLGSKVEIGYYDQEHHVLHPEKNLYEEISDEYPYLTITEIRNTLAAFLFTGDDVFKLVRDLSGGERGRLSLAKLMLSDCNFLILDEPTNHLDIQSKEILETAINSYEGTVLYVSHDRYFINKTATRILELTGGNFVNYIGNYDYYLEKHDDVIHAAINSGLIDLTGSKVSEVPGSNGADVAGSKLSGVFGSKGADGAGNKVSAVAGSNKSETNNITEAALDWKAQKAQAAEQRKKENALKKCEEAIATAEAELSEVDAKLSDPSNGNNVALLQELSRNRDEISAKLDKLYEEWEELAE